MTFHTLARSGLSEFGVTDYETDDDLIRWVNKQYQVQEKGIHLKLLKSQLKLTVFDFQNLCDSKDFSCFVFSNLLWI